MLGGARQFLLGYDQDAADRVFGRNTSVVLRVDSGQRAEDEEGALDVIGAVRVVADVDFGPREKVQDPCTVKPLSITQMR